MQNATLKAVGRGNETPNGLRRSGLIPAVIYGPSISNQVVAVKEQALNHLMNRGNPNAPFPLELEDGSSQTVMIKDVQRHPARGIILHVDFMAVDMDQKITTTVPLNIEGEGKATATGGILQVQLREVNVSCLPADLPEAITVDISDLSIGDVLTVADLTLPEGVELLEEPERVVLTILQPRLGAEGEGEEAADAGEDGAEQASDGEGSE